MMRGGVPVGTSQMERDMTSEILTVATPMGVDPDRGPVSYTTLYEDLDGDGVAERIEIEDEPRLKGSPFREWRVYRKDETVPLAVAAGVEIEIRRSGSGAAVLVSDEAFWRIASNGKMYPYADLVMSRSEYMVMGSKEDRDLIDAYGAPGIFLENVRTISVQLSDRRGKHRVIAGGGYAFMDRLTETYAFVIADHNHVPVLASRSTGHPWLFRRGGGFTLITDNRYGFQISLIPEGFFG